MEGDIGHRQLAAIIFTDVVGFSSRVADDEEKTLRRVREDLQLLTDLSGGHNGKIVKTMGDGLLISFGSAIDAVSFAVEAQKKLYYQNQKLSPNERLEHRMGIHLGDIFITESDAMGDGVNIAARLQSEAEPGGICVSQTVYDVVKNKLSINAVSIGPRELKNIREAIYAYRIVVDAESGLAGKSAAGEAAPRTRRRIVIYSVVASAAVIVVGTIFALRGPGFRPPTQPPGQEVHGLHPAEISSESEEPVSRDLRSTTLEWVRPRLARYDRENPLRLRVPRRPGARGRGGVMPPVISVWMEGEEVVIDAKGDIRRRRLEQLDPIFIGAIGKAISREERSGNPITSQNAGVRE